MSKRHHMQIARSRNLQLIQEWIRSVGDKPIDRDALIRKACLVLGCSKRKAIEYVNLILGEEQPVDPIIVE